MASPFAEDFMKSLQEIERTGDVEPLARLFAADAEAVNLATTEPDRGPDGVRKFWRDYLKAFGRIRSTFFHTAEGDNTVVLEWVGEGELPNGHPIRYRGISVIERAGDKVKKFRTYYDSAAFVNKDAQVGA